MRRGPLEKMWRRWKRRHQSGDDQAEVVKDDLASTEEGGGAEAPVETAVATSSEASDDAPEVSPSALDAVGDQDSVGVQSPASLDDDFDAFQEWADWIADLRERRALPVFVRRRLRWGRIAAWGLLIVLVWVWWTTATSTANARIAALQTVEPYAFSVHEQLVRNFGIEGRFFQTIHKGYDDAWTWSGHRALTLIAAGWVYPFDASAFGLSRVLLLATLLGVLPAALLGRMAMRGAPAGLAIGALCYLASPTVMAVALQDYQDLAFAMPALVFCWWAMRSRWWWMAPVGTFVGMAPREECIPMAVGIALISVPWGNRRPRWRRWLWNLVAAVVVAAVYVRWAETYFPVQTSGHDMPLENALRSLLGGQESAIFLDGWEFIDDFYIWLAVPFGLLAFLAPEALLPVLMLVLLHMTVPVGHGVDRAWSGHSHHLAPAAGLMSIATTLGAARLLRLIPVSARRRHLLHFIAVGILAAVGLRGFQSMATMQDFPLTASFESPAFVHPAWRLASRIPADAVPITSRELSPAISAWREAYTYDGSLASKASRKGLGAGSHIIFDSRNTEVAAWVEGIPETRLDAMDGPFKLVSWSAGQVDTLWPDIKGVRLSRMPDYLGRYSSAGDIPRVAPHEGGQRLSGPAPRLVLPWVDAEPLVPGGAGPTGAGPGGAGPGGAGPGGAGQPPLDGPPTHGSP